MLAKIDIKFIQDWSPLIKTYNKLNRVTEGKPKSAKYIKNFKSYRFDFGSSGALVTFDSIVSGTDYASNVSGPMVENKLPWTNRLRQDMSDLNIAGITFQSNFGSLLPHIDGQEKDSTNFHCKLNYIVDDFDACTYADDGDTILSYPSARDTAWLLDTTKRHWVNGNGQRYIFQICFHQKYSEVLDWFNNHPNLIYQ